MACQSALQGGSARRWLSRTLRKWLSVNGGVLLISLVVQAVSQIGYHAGGLAVAAAMSTATLYCAVFAAATLTLRGRRRVVGGAVGSKPATAIAWSSLIAHPIGSACERAMHDRYLTASSLPLRAIGGSPIALATGFGWWWGGLALRLLLLEVLFDGFFYLAHRAVHAHPTVYQYVHKLHHRHTHDVWLLSSLQARRADALLHHPTHSSCCPRCNPPPFLPPSTQTTAPKPQPAAHPQPTALPEPTALPQPTAHPQPADERG